jgi:uncharacterized protein
MPDKNQGEPGDRRSGRGFAGMDPHRQRQIASEGGRAAHAQGTAHEFTSEEAREAGRKGGEASRAARARRSGPSSSSSSSNEGESRSNAAARNEQLEERER